MQAAVSDMAAKLGDVNRNDLVAFTPRDGAFPLIEVHGGILHWVVVERGQELERCITENLGELLHWVALDSTFSMALRWEVGQRSRFPSSRDTQIGLLAKQMELLRRLNAEWAEQFRAGIPSQFPGVRLEEVDARPLG